MCERIQLKRSKGWRMPANTKKVDRSTAYGSPFKVKRYEGFWTVYDMRRGRSAAAFVSPLFEDEAAAAAVACVMFEGYLWECLSNFPDFLENLRDKNLACGCKPGAPCHADVLLRVLGQYNPGMEE